MGKILITYDSGYGATAAAAKTIAENLTEKGLKVDLCTVVGLEDLSGYDALFLGSSIRLGQCTQKTKRFLKKNYKALKYIQAAIEFFLFMAAKIAFKPTPIPLPVICNGGNFEFEELDKGRG